MFSEGDKEVLVAAEHTEPLSDNSASVRNSLFLELFRSATTFHKSVI